MKKKHLICSVLFSSQHLTFFGAGKRNTQRNGPLVHGARKTNKNVQFMIVFFFLSKMLAFSLGNLLSATLYQHRITQFFLLCLNFVCLMKLFVENVIILYYFQDIFPHVLHVILWQTLCIFFCEAEVHW